mmetsp:Transcript_10541/g.64713  ORF Transcript_10541/g.64713 Transcript_10541/m.64713 type:complete len:88 (-) Transcript_10541:3430-3693(-)
MDAIQQLKQRVVENKRSTCTGDRDVVQSWSADRPRCQAEESRTNTSTSCEEKFLATNGKKRQWCHPCHGGTMNDMATEATESNTNRT